MLLWSKYCKLHLIDILVAAFWRRSRSWESTVCGQDTVLGGEGSYLLATLEIFIRAHVFAHQRFSTAVRTLHDSSGEKITVRVLLTGFDTLDYHVDQPATARLYTLCVAKKNPPDYISYTSSRSAAFEHFAMRTRINIKCVCQQAATQLCLLYTSIQKASMIRFT